MLQFISALLENLHPFWKKNGNQLSLSNNKVDVFCRLSLVESYFLYRMS